MFLQLPCYEQAQFLHHKSVFASLNLAVEGLPRWFDRFQSPQWDEFSGIRLIGSTKEDVKVGEPIRIGEIRVKNGRLDIQFTSLHI